MKVILQGPPASGKTTLASIIIGDRDFSFINGVMTNLEGALLACKHHNWIANIDNADKLTPEILRILESVDCDLIVTTLNPVDIDTIIPVFQLTRPSKMKKVTA